MRISIVMPTLNEERGVGQTLTRTLALPVHEIVVVDGNSRDRTRDIVASVQAIHPRVALLVSEPGRARQMNAGSAVCSGEALVFLHADTFLAGRRTRGHRTGVE